MNRYNPRKATYSQGFPVPESANCKICHKRFKGSVLWHGIDRVAIFNKYHYWMCDPCRKKASR